MVSGTSVWEQLQAGDRAFLTWLAESAGPAARVALVGGAVRDALLGRTPLDLDVVVEGADVEALAAATGLPFVFHPAFQNAAVTLPDGRGVDLVRSRRESYPAAGQNPLPEPGTLEDDLRRRDFSLNALALLLSGGGVLDVVGGLDDLAARVLRPLHAQSFHDDPSRLIRGVRLAARLNLAAHCDLLAQVPDALALAGQTPRLWAELKLLLAEPRPGKAARRLVDWGAGELLPPTDLLSRLDALQDAGTAVNFQAYAAALLSAAPNPDALAERLSLGDRPAALLARVFSEDYFAPDTAEMQLRGLLRPGAYVPLTGKDVLAVGVAPGRGVGEALAYLAGLRRGGQLESREAERAALAEYVKNRRD
ncbi:CCA tRNA nucleotidyltransferase [Deinococcus sp.]|uniref:CCA tRNA nucleotidyltransferase n=1 Tax=Deinococcus sp. TaxID=47478 RepID=UPI0025C1A889|nr:CCA tRNA nucleotidyltransferase [Deinococcus sp.]